MLLNIVFSFRNEESNIPELVKRVSAAVATIPDLSYEMIFVNDASTDESLELLLELRRTYPITIVNMSRNFGVTPCVLAGFSFCKGDAVVYMDADLQDPPELIPELVRRYRDGASVVHTKRISREGESRIKMLVTRTAYKFINFFSDIALPQNVGDFKLAQANPRRSSVPPRSIDGGTAVSAVSAMGGCISFPPVRALGWRLEAAASNKKTVRGSDNADVPSRKAAVRHFENNYHLRSQTRESSHLRIVLIIKKKGRSPTARIHVLQSPSRPARFLRSGHASRRPVSGRGCTRE